MSNESQAQPCLVCKMCGAAVVEQEHLLHSVPAQASPGCVYTYELENVLGFTVNGFLVHAPLSHARFDLVLTQRMWLHLTMIWHFAFMYASDTILVVWLRNLIFRLCFCAAANVYVVRSNGGTPPSIGEPFVGAESETIGCARCHSPIGFRFYKHIAADPNGSEHARFNGVIVTRLRERKLTPDELSASRRGGLPRGRYECMLELMEELLHSRFGLGIRQVRLPCKFHIMLACSFSLFLFL